MLGRIVAFVQLTVEGECQAEALNGIALQTVGIRTAILAFENTGEESLVSRLTHIPANVRAADEQGAALCRIGLQMGTQLLRESLVWNE